MKFYLLSITIFFSINYVHSQSANNQQILYKKMTEAYTKAQKKSTQYPYLNAQKYFQVIFYGEKLLSEYPDTKYFRQTRKQLLDAIEHIGDIHIVKKYGITNYIHFYANVNIKYAADKHTIDSFLTKYPNSKYASVFKKILQAPSEIELKDKQILPDTLYLIVIKKFPSLSYAQNKKFELLSKGYDIIHTFVLQYTSNEQFILVYRFYTNKTKAIKALKKIKKKFADSYIITGKPQKNTKIIIPYERLKISME